MAKNGKQRGAKKILVEEIARAVGAGRPLAVETVDFSDPARPKTCLEVDFPIVPVNHVAIIEGSAAKPIYQMSKWWARRRSSVFRSTLLAASMKAPADPAKAAKMVWDVYYANHQKTGALKHLRVADIFMGGGTTVVEAARLGMQVWGTDLNPIAWFIVKNELAKVTVDELDALFADVEADVKPQIMPFYACDCPRGHKGTWTHISTGRVMDVSFDPLDVPREQRSQYRYQGPEVIYVFWAKHGPCQVAGCGHRTPVMSSPLIAVKTLSVKSWENYSCPACGERFDIETGEARMAPGVPFVVAETEAPYSCLSAAGGANCPYCGEGIQTQFDAVGGLMIERPSAIMKLGKGKNKKVELSLLVHPEWLAGAPRVGPDGKEFGGSVTDSPESTASWNRERARHARLIEVRGKLPHEVTCPETKVTFSTSNGTVPKKSNYACGACGTVQDVLETVKRSGKTAPGAAYAFQGYCPECDRAGRIYSGRFFAPATETSTVDQAAREWLERSEVDLATYWPRSQVPYGFMTSMNNGGIANHGYTHWWKMFSPRQLLVHAQLLKAISTIGEHKQRVREYVLGGFQQYLQAQTMLCWWNIQTDRLAVAFSHNNFHPKATLIEGGSLWAPYGHSRWASCASPVYS